MSRKRPARLLFFCAVSLLLLSYTAFAAEYNGPIGKIHPEQSVVIPVYSAEDWQGLTKEQTFTDRFGAYIVMGSAIIAAAAVLFAAKRLRKKIR